jgi:P-type E1-E2 ATPase
MAASLEQFSAHVIAEALVHQAEEQGLALLHPQNPKETPGQGISGDLPGGRLLVGSPGWLQDQDDYALPGIKLSGETQVGVVYKQEPVGSIFLADQLRQDAKQTLDRLAGLGVEHRMMLTGDQTETAQRIAEQLPLDRVYANLSPEEKMRLVAANSGSDRTLIMLGDGINDAPALALADVGIAMGGRGSAASAQSADMVILEDRLELVARVVEIGRSTLRIARQSVWAGMVLSIGAMIVAFLGYLPPAAGALLQEGIDVAVILNALRARKI